MCSSDLGTDPDRFEFQRGRGCERCNHMGHLSRMGLFEMLAVDDTVGAAFVDNRNALAVRRVAEAAGSFLSLREAAFLMALNGVITLEEAMTILSFSDRQGGTEMNLSAADIASWNTLPDDDNETNF